MKDHRLSPAIRHLRAWTSASKSAARYAETHRMSYADSTAPLTRSTVMRHPVLVGILAFLITFGLGWTGLAVFVF